MDIMDTAKAHKNDKGLSLNPCSYEMRIEFIDNVSDMYIGS